MTCAAANDARTNAHHWVCGRKPVELGVNFYGQNSTERE